MCNGTITAHHFIKILKYNWTPKTETFKLTKKRTSKYNSMIHLKSYRVLQFKIKQAPTNCYTALQINTLFHIILESDNKNNGTPLNFASSLIIYPKPPHFYLSLLSETNLKGQIQLNFKNRPYSTADLLPKSLVTIILTEFIYPQRNLPYNLSKTTGPRLILLHPL